MKHIFIPNTKGKQVRGGVRGDLRSYADTVNVQSPHIIDNTDGITDYVAPPVPTGQQAYDAAASLFNSLPLGKQAMWEPVRKAVADALLVSNFTKAKEILSTVPVTYEGAETDRSMFLQLFP